LNLKCDFLVSNCALSFKFSLCRYVTARQELVGGVPFVRISEGLKNYVNRAKGTRQPRWGCASCDP
jgi:hypothetical protein